MKRKQNLTFLFVVEWSETIEREFWQIKTERERKNFWHPVP